MAYEGFKDLTRRGASGKIWREKAFNIAKKPEYNGYQTGLDSMIYFVWLKIKLCLIKN